MTTKEYYHQFYACGFVNDDVIILGNNNSTGKDYSTGTYANEH